MRRTGGFFRGNHGSNVQEVLVRAVVCFNKVVETLLTKSSDEDVISEDPRFEPKKLDKGDPRSK